MFDVLGLGPGTFDGRLDSCRRDGPRLRDAFVPARPALRCRFPSWAFSYEGKVLVP